MSRFQTITVSDGQGRVSIVVVQLTDGTELRTACRGSLKRVTKCCDAAEHFRVAERSGRR